MNKFFPYSGSIVTSEFVERVKAFGAVPADEVATAIFERDAEIKRLREALEVFADAQNWFDTDAEPGGPYPAWRGPKEPEMIAMNALSREAAR